MKLSKIKSSHCALDSKRSCHVQFGFYRSVFFDKKSLQGLFVSACARGSAGSQFSRRAVVLFKAFDELFTSPSNRYNEISAQSDNTPLLILLSRFIKIQFQCQTMPLYAREKDQNFSQSRFLNIISLHKLT